MPPKKQVADTKSVLLGRLGTSLKIGIVGLPNVGKSTFFNILTKSEVAAENFPFCTIDPNESRVAIPDKRYDNLVEVCQPLKKVPAFLSVVDIAGLVKGAHEGAGLGNAFLSNIDSCDAIFHMCRIFEDEDITHVEDSVDPVRDMEIIFNELRLKDLVKVTKRIPDVEKVYKSGNNRSMKTEFDTLVKAKEWLEAGNQIRTGDWTEPEIEELNRVLFLTAKPHIYLCNMSAKHYVGRKSKGVVPVKQWIDKNDPGALMIPYSAKFEQTIYEMEEAEREAYLKEKKTASMLDKIIINGFQKLNLQVFFTYGTSGKEIKTWTIKQGSTAPMAAGRVHTDFQKGFIMAEVMSYADFEEEGSEAKCKANGKYRQFGKTYVVNDGDIIYFKFNAPKEAKKKAGSVFGGG